MTRIVLVTGANRGIGRELARQLALRGDVVVLTARDLAKAERAADLQTVREGLEVNLLGAWQTSLTLLPLLRASHQGRIVNVSSEAGSLASMNGGTPADNVSKAALNASPACSPATCAATASWSTPSAPAGWPPTWAARAAARWPRARPASCGPSTCPTTAPRRLLPRRPPVPW